MLECEIDSRLEPPVIPTDTLGRHGITNRQISGSFFWVAKVTDTPLCEKEKFEFESSQ